MKKFAQWFFYPVFAKLETITGEDGKESYRFLGKDYDTAPTESEQKYARNSAMGESIKKFVDWFFYPAFVVLVNYMSRVGLILYGGKGGSPSAPDYGPMAAASEEAARLGAELGREQLAETKSQFEQGKEIIAPIIQAQKGVMDQSIVQGDDYFKYMKDTFRPIEEGLAEEAESGSNRYNTNQGVRANVEEMASRASADVARASANAQGQSNRAMAAMGINPNSGRFTSMQVGQDLANAGMRAGAQTQSRTQGIALDYAKRMDVTGLGRGLPGASQGAYGVAMNAGNSAAGNQNQTAGQYLNGLSAGNSTIMQGQGMKMQGLGNVLNSQTSVYGSQMANQGSDFLGSIGGILGGGAAAYTAFSDRRLKENIVKVGEDARGFGLYEFSYIDSPDRRYRGVMADEIQSHDLDAVVVADNGYLVVDYGRLGLEMTEVVA